jgi:hypothetical protein
MRMHEPGSRVYSDTKFTDTCSDRRVYEVMCERMVI